MYIRIGTRGSKLALIQTNLVIDEIKKHISNAICEIIPVITTADKIQDQNLYEIGGKALFLKEIEELLLDNKLDIAVHSLKDIPGKLPDNLMIAAMLKRHDARDVFISNKATTISNLPKKAIIGTSSARRSVLIKNIRPDLNIVTLRGNVDTRIKKIKTNMVDATILAYAGLERSGLYDKDLCHPMPEYDFIPAVGQGIIAIEIISNNTQMLELCKKINHIDTWHLGIAERSFLAYLNADCSVPLGAYSRYKKSENDSKKIVTTKYMLAKGKKYNDIRYHTEICNIEEVNQSGINAAKKLLK